MHVLVKRDLEGFHTKGSSGVLKDITKGFPERSSGFYAGYFKRSSCKRLRKGIIGIYCPGRTFQYGFR